MFTYFFCTSGPRYAAWLRGYAREAQVVNLRENPKIHALLRGAKEAGKEVLINGVQDAEEVARLTAEVLSRNQLDAGALTFRSTRLELLQDPRLPCLLAVLPTPATHSL